MDPERLLRDRLGRAAGRPLSRQLEARVLSRTSRREPARGSRLLVLGATVSTALVVGGALYGVASLGRHHLPAPRPPQGAGVHTPRPSAARQTPTPTPPPARTPAPPPTPRPPLGAPTSPPTTPPSPTVPATGSHSPRAVPVLACLGPSLTITVRPGPWAGGTATVVYVLENVGGRTCTLRGIPTVREVVPGGGPGRSAVERRRAGRRPRVTLRPGQVASFVLRDLGCRERTLAVSDAALELEVTLPGASGRSPLLVRGGLACGPTVVEVSAIVAGVVHPRLGHARHARNPSHRSRPRRSPTPRVTLGPTATPVPTPVRTPTRATPTPRPTATPTARPAGRATPSPTLTPRATPRLTPVYVQPTLPVPTPTPIPLCTAADLHFALYSGPVPSGATSVSLGLSDAAATPCLLVGLPQVSLTTSDGTTVPLALGSVSYNPSVELVLAPGGAVGGQSAGAVVVLDLQWSEASLSCPAASAVSITPAYVGTTLSTRGLPIPVCAGASNLTAQLQAFGS